MSSTDANDSSTSGIMATIEDIDLQEVQIPASRPSKDDIRMAKEVEFAKQECQEASTKGTVAFLAQLGFEADKKCPPWVSLSGPVRCQREEIVAPYTGAQEYLALYNFDVFGKPWHATWSKYPEYGFPKLELRVDGHEEAGGHTYYNIECTILCIGESCLSWRVPRRLCDLRARLHDPVKQALRNDIYSEYFGATPFARSGGMWGTTARLDAWCKSFAHCFNSGQVPPLLLAMVLRFLHAPQPSVIGIRG